LEGVEAATPVIQSYVVARIKPSGEYRFIKPIVRPCLLLGIRPAEKAQMGRFLEYLGRKGELEGAPPEAAEHLLDVPPEYRKEGQPEQSGIIAGKAVVGIPVTTYVPEDVTIGAGRRVLAWFLAAVATVVFLFIWRAAVHRPGNIGWRAAMAVSALSAAGLYVAALAAPVHPGQVIRPEVDDRRVLRYGDGLVVSTIPVRPSGALETEPGGIPRGSSRVFVLVDVFRSKYWEADSSHLYVDFGVAQQMAGMEGSPAEGVPARASQIQVKVRDPATAGTVVDRIQKAWEAFQAERQDEDLPHVTVNTWETQQRMILTVVKIQRNITTLMLGLMFVGFAVLIALISYVMAYIKSRDVGILKAVGASDAGVGSLFLGYGFLIGLVGTALGMIGALLMLHYLDPIEIWVNQTLNVDIFPREMYYFDRIPRHLSPWWCVGVSGAVLALATLASMVGGLLAAIRQPVETLRYE